MSEENRKYFYRLHQIDDAGNFLQNMYVSEESVAAILETPVKDENGNIRIEYSVLLKAQVRDQSGSVANVMIRVAENPLRVHESVGQNKINGWYFDPVVNNGEGYIEGLKNAGKLKS